LEFVIYPDGRVEERVKGVKGANCQELTAKLEAALGKVRAGGKEGFVKKEKAYVEISAPVTPPQASRRYYARAQAVRSSPPSLRRHWKRCGRRKQNS
jgi:hypothetical protein